MFFRIFQRESGSAEITPLQIAFKVPQLKAKATKIESGTAM